MVKPTPDPPHCTLPHDQPLPLTLPERNGLWPGDFARPGKLMRGNVGGHEFPIGRTDFFYRDFDHE